MGVFGVMVDKYDSDLGRVMSPRLHARTLTRFAFYRRRLTQVTSMCIIIVSFPIDKSFESTQQRFHHEK